MLGGGEKETQERQRMADKQLKTGKQTDRLMQKWKVGEGGRRWTEDVVRKTGKAKQNDNNIQ